MTGATIDRQALMRRLAENGLDGMALAKSHPALFADAVVDIGQEAWRAMTDIVAAIETVVASPAYRQAALAQAPDIARHDPGYPGVFLAYDFHLGGQGPQLIEINSNAGGGMLNACLLAALPAGEGRGGRSAGQVEELFLAMFREEWRLAKGGQARLERIAIVDDDPRGQFLWPEFQLFRHLFRAAGIDALIADPGELFLAGERLMHASGPVDMIYNRLTDFALREDAHAHLRFAWQAGGVVLTPHPGTHALYADKRNLIFLSDPAWLAAAGVSPELRRVLLAGIPRTLPVTRENADTFWQERRKWFFKPAAGFGSRAVYRGDKLTRRVFAQIAASPSGSHIAQALVPPSTWRVTQDGEARELKVDIRNYAYRGKIQLTAARLYQGQTTNSRTPGGGFAAVRFEKG